LSPPAMNNNKLKVVLHTHIPTNSDQVMGGVSMARLTREMFDGRMANVLRGSVKMDNNGGFIQMATNLQRDGTSVDVSAFDGVELLVQSGSPQMESFNVQYVVSMFNVVCDDVRVLMSFCLFCSLPMLLFVVVVFRLTVSRRPIVCDPFRRTAKPLRCGHPCGNRSGCHSPSFAAAVRVPNILRLIYPRSNGSP
jgi:Complex I intermediate-associated protein 30 (CIA30)